MATPSNLPASFVSGQVLTAADQNNLRGAFRVLQVKQTTVNTTTTTTSATLVDIPGMSVSITPQSASSKVLVTVNMFIGFGTLADDTFYTLFREATAISIGSGGGTNCSVYLRGNSSGVQNLALIPVGISFLDSPSTTSATTYKMQYATRVNEIFLNRRGSDNNFVTSSSITVQEISA